jgi:tetratricopeptide (TPR) repeat protein
MPGPSGRNRPLTLRPDGQLNPDHPDVALSLNNLALVYHTQGRYAEAEPLFKQALMIGEKTLGLDHPTFVTFLNNYEGLLRQTSRQAEAEQLITRVLATISTKVQNIACEEPI